MHGEVRATYVDTFTLERYTMKRELTNVTNLKKNGFTLGICRRHGQHKFPAKTIVGVPHRQGPRSRGTRKIRTKNYRRHISLSIFYFDLEATLNVILSRSTNFWDRYFILIKSLSLDRLVWTFQVVI